MNTKINLNEYLAKNFCDFTGKIEETKSSYSLIPAGTLAQMKLTIKSGNYEVGSPDTFWITQSLRTGALYLNCEFTIIGGKFDGRKVWSLIGIYSAKGPEWGNMGKAFIKNILASAHNIPKNPSEDAQEKLIIQSFDDLQGLLFLGRVDVETHSETGEKKNVVKVAILPENPRYKDFMQSDIAQLNVRI